VAKEGALGGRWKGESQIPGELYIRGSKGMNTCRGGNNLLKKSTSAHNIKRWNDLLYAHEQRDTPTGPQKSKKNGYYFQSEIA